MELRHLRYFVAVAEELSFTRAAKRMNIAQPPLSQQIRQLEDELGLRLLHRTRRRVEISDAGRVFLERARRILREIDEAAIQAQRAQRGETGSISIGFFEYISYTFLPPILRDFRKNFPGVELQLRWIPVIGQADALRRGEIDVSFLRPVSDFAGISTVRLLKEPFVLAVPSEHRLAARDAVSLEECALEPFVLYEQRAAPDFHSTILRMCGAAGFTPRMMLEIGQIHTALGVVSSGSALAFLPSSMQHVHVDYVAYKRIRGDLPKIEVLLGWTQRNPSALLTAFLQTARRVTDAVRTV